MKKFNQFKKHIKELILCNEDDLDAAKTFIATALMLVFVCAMIGGIDGLGVILGIYAMIIICILLFIFCFFIADFILDIFIKLIKK